MAGEGDPAALDGALVRICDLAGRPRGTGFAADDHGTVITSHEAVDGLARLVLHAAGERVCVVSADSVVALPEADLALVRTEGLGLRPLPVTVRDTVPVGAYVHIVARGLREARVLGPAPVTYTATDRFHLIDTAMELAIGTDGADALRLGGGAAGGPVIDASSGAVLAVLGTALHGEHSAAGFAVRLRHAAAAAPGGPLAELLARNAATVPAYGRDLNLAGVLHLAATSVGSDGPCPALLEPVERPDTTRELTDFTAGPAQVLGLVGDPGTGRTTELAALAAGRARGAEPAPTLWLRGADLQGTDTGVGDAVERALERAGRIVEASEASGGADASEGSEASEGSAVSGDSDDGLGDISAGRVARLVGDEGRPLLLLLDGPEEMPPVLAHRLAEWSGGTAEWLRGTGARLVVGCRAEYWEQAGAHFPAELLPRLGCVHLGDLPERQARIARARYGIPDGALAAADARHPLALRLLAEVRAALPDEPPPGCPDREEIFEAYLDLLCLRVAVRLAAANGLRGTAVRRLAAKVSGQVHEAARRCLGPGQGELDRASFEGVFPWGTGWASAVLTEGLLVPAGGGYRFAHEELADWIQGMHLDVDGALWSLVFRHREPMPGAVAALPVPRHRIGPVIQALLLLGRQRGPAELEARLGDLARFAELRPSPHESPPGIQGCAHPSRPTGRMATAAEGGPAPAAEGGEAAAPVVGGAFAAGDGEAAAHPVVGRRSARRWGSPRSSPAESGGGRAQPPPPGADVVGDAGSAPAPWGADAPGDGGNVPVPPGADVVGDGGSASSPWDAHVPGGGGNVPASWGVHAPEGGGIASALPGADVVGDAGTASSPWDAHAPGAAGNAPALPGADVVGDAGSASAPWDAHVPGGGGNVPASWGVHAPEGAGIASAPPGADVVGGAGSAPASWGVHAPEDGGSAPSPRGAHAPGGGGSAPAPPGADVPGDAGSAPAPPGAHAPGGGGSVPAPWGADVVGDAGCASAPWGAHAPGGGGSVPAPPGADVPGDAGCAPAPSGALAPRGGGSVPAPWGADVPGDAGCAPAPSGALAPGGGGSVPAPPGADVPGDAGSAPAPPGADVPGGGGSAPAPPGDHASGDAGNVPPLPGADIQRDAQWWAAHLLGETLQRVGDAEPYLGLLKKLAQRGTRPAAFWMNLPLAEGPRFDLLREAVIHDPPPSHPPRPPQGRRCLDAVAELLAKDPARVQAQLTRWFADDRPLEATPHATVASAAQALLHTHRHRAIDDLTEVLVDSAHPRADELLAVLAEEEPSAICRAVDRWVHDERPARRVAAVAYGLHAAPHATTDADRRLLRYAAFALLARTADDTLHGAALALLVRDPQTRARHLPPALKRFTAGDPQLPASALVAALDTHPEQVLAAFRTRLYGPGPAPGDVLRGLAGVTATPAARRVADLVRDVLELRPDLAGHVAGYLDLRFEQGPGVRAVLFPLVTGLFRHHTPAVRAALAAAVAAPGTDVSRALRTELLDVLLAQEREPEVLDAVLCAAAGDSDNDRERVRELVHRTGVLLVRTPEGATCFDRRLVELARSVPGFSGLVSRWICTSPQDWSALVCPSARRMIENLAGARVPA